MRIIRGFLRNGRALPKTERRLGIENARLGKEIIVTDVKRI